MDQILPLLTQDEGPAADTVSNALIAQILRAAEGLRAPVAQILRETGLDEARIRHPLGGVAFPVLVRLLQQLEDHFDNPAASVRLASLTIPASFSDPGYACRLVPRLEDGIQSWLKLLAGQQNSLSSNYDQATAQIEWKLKGTDPMLAAPFVEFVVAAQIEFSRRVMMEPLHLQRLSLQHAPRFDPALYTSLFGLDVRFGASSSAVRFELSQLVLPTRMANARLRSAMTGLYGKPRKLAARGKPLTAQSFLFLLTQMDKPSVTLDRMAAAFGMTERTLRRKLTSEGYPFRKLMDEVRQDLFALYRMEAKRSLGEIALLLGYSSLSAFTRAKQRWTKVKPAASL